MAYPDEKSGIYKIRNINNNKIYIGSSVTILFRFANHKAKLRHNKHSNPHLQRAWDKYGEDSFEFTILEECQENMLIIREDAWINYYDSMNLLKGYNLQNASRTIGGMKGKHHSEETKRKLSIANTGKINKSVSKSNSKRIWSKDSIAKMGKHNGCYKDNHIVSQLVKDKIGNANSRRIWSSESKQKIKDRMTKYWANRKLEENNELPK